MDSSACGGIGNVHTYSPSPVRFLLEYDSAAGLNIQLNVDCAPALGVTPESHTIAVGNDIGRLSGRIKRAHRISTGRRTRTCGSDGSKNQVDGRER